MWEGIQPAHAGEEEAHFEKPHVEATCHTTGLQHVNVEAGLPLTSLRPQRRGIGRGKGPSALRRARRPQRRTSGPAVAVIHPYEQCCFVLAGHRCASMLASS